MKEKQRLKKKEKEECQLKNIWRSKEKGNKDMGQGEKHLEFDEENQEGMKKNASKKGRTETVE